MLKFSLISEMHWNILLGWLISHKFTNFSWFAPRAPKDRTESILLNSLWYLLYDLLVKELVCKNSTEILISSLILLSQCFDRLKLRAFFYVFVVPYICNYESKFIIAEKHLFVYPTSRLSSSFGLLYFSHF